jgi:outer membrane lipoprotein-sorting protein
MQIFARTPVLRWLAPALVAVVLLGGGWTVNQIAASAQEGLQPRTAAQLLVDVQHAHLDGLSGTIVQRSDLGIPSVPGVGGAGSSDLSSLVSGTHTMRVWFSGPDRARLALMGTFGESDVVLNGKDLWTWSSHDKAATHRGVKLPSGSKPDALAQPGALPKTPQEAADVALRAISPSTKVSTSGTAVVAGRRAYELVLQPRDAASLVGQVRIAIDGKTHVPLRVQVLARGADTPAFEVAFTQFDPTRPDAAQFRFNPPPGTKVTDGDGAGKQNPAGMRTHGDMAAPKVIGKAWTTVVVARTPVSAGDAANMPGQLSQLMRALPRVSGSWGSGRLLAGSLFSVLLTNDGRLVVGAVTPQRLYDALAAR